jgi:hypothetical protein
MSEKSFSPTAMNIPPQNISQDAVSLMQAAFMARVHLTNLYRLRPKLGAFKRDGVWYIPLEALQAYIQRREARARDVLARPAA